MRLENSTTELQMKTYHDWKTRSNGFFMTYHGQRMKQEDLEYKAVAIHRPLQSWTSSKQLPWSGRNYIFMDGFMWLDIQGRDHNSLGSSFVEKQSKRSPFRQNEELLQLFLERRLDMYFKENIYVLTGLVSATRTSNKAQWVRPGSEKTIQFWCSASLEQTWRKHKRMNAVRMDKSRTST
jgi:hypothetical protein